MEKEKGQRYRKIKWNKQLVSVATGVLLLAPLVLGSVESFAAEKTVQATIGEKLLNTQSLVMGAVTPGENEYEYEVTERSDIQKVINDRATVGADTPTTIILQQDITIDQRINLNGRNIIIQSPAGENYSMTLNYSGGGIINVNDRDDTPAKLSLNNVTVDGNQYIFSNSQPLITVNNSTLNLESGTTVTNGNGGAIAANNESIVNVNKKSVISGISTERSGSGGAINAKGGSKITVAGTIENNQAARGGAIYSTGSADAKTSVIVKNTGVIKGNKVPISDNSGYGGGGIYAASGSEVVIDGGALSGNTSVLQGGAIYATGTSANPTTVDIKDSNTNITGNKATTNGGAIYASGATTVSIEEGTIEGNEAMTNGGAIYAASGADLNLTGGTIKDNSTSGNGGAIYSVGTATNTATVTINQENDKTTLIDNNTANSAGSAGGALYVGNYSNATLTAGTISNNQATNTTDGTGGAVRVGHANGTFAMAGGVMLNNTSDAGNTVSTVDNGTLDIRSGVIYGERENAESPNFLLEGGQLLGTAILVAKTDDSANKDFSKGDGDNLTVSYGPGANTTKSVTWDRQNDFSGITYTHDANTGFFVVPDVNVKIPVDTELKLNTTNMGDLIYDGTSHEVKKADIESYNEAEFGEIAADGITYAPAINQENPEAYTTDAPVDAGEYAVKIKTDGSGSKYQAFDGVVGTFEIASQKVTPTISSHTVKVDEVVAPTITYNGEKTDSIDASDIYKTGQEPTLKYGEDPSFEDPTYYAGEKAITVLDLGTYRNNNYTVDFTDVSGKLIVNKIDFDEAKGKLNYSYTKEVEYTGVDQGITTPTITGDDENLGDYGKIKVEYAIASDLEKNVSYSFGDVLPKDADDYKIKITVDETGRKYKGFSSEELDYTINKKGVQATIGDLSVPVGTDMSTMQQPTINFNGFVNNETEHSVFAGIGSPTVKYVAEATNKKGTSSISIDTEKTGKPKNYNINYIPGTLTVTAVNFPTNALTYTVPENAEYNGTAQGIENVKINRYDEAEFGAITVTYATEDSENYTAEAPTQAGVYKAKISVAGGNKYPTYERIETYAIAKKAVEVKAADVVVDQNAQLPAEIGIEYTGFIEGQSADTAFVSGEKPKGVYSSNSATAGEFPITITPGNLTAEANANYTINYVDGKLTVNAVEQPTPDPDPEPTPDPEPEPTPEPTPSEERVPIYRLYNRNNGEHIFTSSRAEADWLLSEGLQEEGVSWYGDDAATGVPVYRLYNANSGEHFYTINRGEYEFVGNSGWTREGVSFYASEEENVPVYRLYNPNARDAGSHHFTIERSENDHLVSVGWIAEAIGFYGK